MPIARAVRTPHAARACATCGRHAVGTPCGMALQGVPGQERALMARPRAQAARGDLFALLRQAKPPQGVLMSRIVFLEERCKGCRLCVEACPVHILRPSGRFNRQGYEVMEMDGQCTGCASCAVMCPDAAIRVFKSTGKKGGEA